MRWWPKYGLGLILVVVVMVVGGWWLIRASGENAKCQAARDELSSIADQAVEQHDLALAAGATDEAAAHYFRSVVEHERAIDYLYSAPPCWDAHGYTSISTWHHSLIEGIEDYVFRWHDIDPIKWWALKDCMVAARSQAAEATCMEQARE